MVAIHDPHSSPFFSLICLANFFLGSHTQPIVGTGIISEVCSAFTWVNSSDTGCANISQDIPLPIDIALLDLLCEDPSCRDNRVMCQVGNCSTCVPITDNYTNRIFFSTKYIEGSGSQYLESENITCSVGPLNTTNPGHYPAECVAANNLVGTDNMYLLVMTVMNQDNTTLLATIQNYVGFNAGPPILKNTWADFESPPIGIYHKNILRLWLKDEMNNTVSSLTGLAWGEPIAFSIVVTTSSGEPAPLQIPPDPDEYVAMGYYIAPITPTNTGDYIATITVGNVHISNSPLHFTVGEKFGIPIRTPSSSTTLRLLGLLSYLPVLSSTIVSHLQGL